MTQILGLLTPNYVMLASDRLLTWSGGPDDGKVYRDEECKLVAVCGYGGIGYTGLARLGNRPAHEWIAVTLAEANCYRLADAVPVLAAKAPQAIKPFARNVQGLTFFAAAWDWFGEKRLLMPHFALVSNQLSTPDESLPLPTSEFRTFVGPLQPDEPFAWHSVGEPVSKPRAVKLNRSLKKALRHQSGPAHLLRYLVEEIQHTSRAASRVGDRILTMCIPRKSVESWLKTGIQSTFASVPNHELATFGYFDPIRDELLQYGPTTVCGQLATTELTTKNEVEANRQWASVQILHLPKKSQ